MRHIFIINPAAGRGASQKQLAAELDARGLTVYTTKRPGDAEDHIRKLCEEGGPENFRFYACGGDGTLNEIVNGTFGFCNAEVAFIPVGSGNDFIRMFDIPLSSFTDIDKQLAGKASYIDLIKYQELDGKSPARYAVNMFNTGFDCNVVANMELFKRYPFVSGPLAYYLSVLFTLVRKDGADLDISFDDGSGYNGYALFAAIGNGAFCGGGLKGIPYAKPDDGLIDVSIVKNIQRRKFASLFKKYADGTYIEDERLKELVVYKKCRSLTVKNRSKARRMCVDGEITPQDEVKFEIAPNALRFSLPSI